MTSSQCISVFSGEMKAARLLRKSANHHGQVGLPHSFFLLTGPFAGDHIGNFEQPSRDLAYQRSSVNQLAWKTQFF